MRGTSTKAYAEILCHGAVTHFKKKGHVQLGSKSVQKATN